MARYGEMFGYPPMPILGPWALFNHLGMDAAIGVVHAWVGQKLLIVTCLRVFTSGHR
jgi:hypothetical protein